eukprot:GHVO01005071.1.p1 GENE.GHVO01005071.1~~GHVO01005071.1.p1  ORF type:complete len:120 (-),score=8.38 GHVO01005071.1:705-1064(-)
MPPWIRTNTECLRSDRHLTSKVQAQNKGTIESVLDKVWLCFRKSENNDEMRSSSGWCMIHMEWCMSVCRVVMGQMTEDSAHFNCIHASYTTPHCYSLFRNSVTAKAFCGSLVSTSHVQW